MGLHTLGLLGLPVLLVGGWAAQTAPAPAGKAEPCCGGSACVDQAKPKPVVVATDTCPPCPPCPQKACPPCDECP